MKTGAVNGDKKMIRPGHTSASKLTRALHVFMVFLTSVSMLPGTVPALQAQQIIIDPSAPSGQLRSSGEVKGPKTLTLIFLPARSPGLDRVGKVWQSLRENGLSDRLLEDQADLLAAGCDAWARLMKEPTAIKSGASRDRTQNGQT